MAKKQALGRGLDSLFLENEEETSGSVMMLRVSEVEPNPTQPRKNFDKEALEQLADSIARHGLLQPIAVRPAQNGFYQIIAGERRWRASKMAGLLEIPAIQYDIDDKKAAELALIENLQREDLGPIEEALAFRSLLEDYGMTQEEAAAQIGKSRSAVANAVRLLDLPEDVVKLVSDGALTAGHARAVLSLTKEADMLPFAKEIVSKNLSVREAESGAKLLNERAKREEIGLSEPPKEPREDTVLQSYLRSLEHRATQSLGRRFRILDDGKSKRVEISYEENVELEFILKRLCGEDFFEKQ